MQILQKYLVLISKFRYGSIIILRPIFESQNSREDCYDNNQISKKSIQVRFCQYFCTAFYPSW